MSLSRQSIILVAAGLFSVSGATVADVRTWPGSPPCHHTLQNCIAGVNPGDVVEIASDAAIDESLLIEDRLVGLRAAEGFHPTLAAGRNLIVDYSPSTTGLEVPFDLVYSGLSLAGGRFEFGTTRTGSVVIERMDITQGGANAGLSVYTQGTDSGAVTHAVVRQNRIRASLNSNESLFAGISRPTRLNIEDNLIESQPGTPNPGASRVALSVIGITQNGSIEIRRNRIVASSDLDSDATRFRGGIDLAPFGGTVSFESRVIDNLIDVGTQASDVAIRSVVGSGNNSLDIINNTIRSVGRGIVLFDTSVAQTALVARIRNNIVARSTSAGVEAGLQWTPGHAGISNDYNLLFNTGGNTVPLGPNTLLADPQFISASNPRLKPTSPAIDAGDYLARQALLRLGAPAPLDNDGLRREIGAWVDLGAFEFGDQSFTHNAGASATSTELSRPGLDDNPAALMLVTRSGGNDTSSIVPSPGPMSQSFGDFTQRWSLLTDDGINLATGAGFTLFQPLPSAAAGTHVASAANNFLVSGTSLGATWANLPSDWIFLVSATRGAGLGSTANPHPFGAAHLNGAWRIVNTDAAALPNNSAFVVYAQAPSRNAFLHTVNAANLVTPVVSLLDHPALNGIPCANPHVSVSGSGQMPTPLVSARYEPSLQRWYLLNASTGIAMAAGNRYAIVIDPRASADACRGPIFANDFE